MGAVVLPRLGNHVKATSLRLDLRHAVRSLLRHPIYFSTAIVSVAIGIGATAGVFSLLHRALLCSLPFPHGSEIVAVLSENQAARGWGNLFSYPDFEDYARELKAFEGVAVFRGSNQTIADSDPPENVSGAQVSWNFFDVLQAPFLLGRGFQVHDDEVGSRRSAVLTYALWVRKYGSDPNILNKTIRLNGQQVAVVGILPPTFQFPYKIKNAQLFTPIVKDAGTTERGSSFFSAIGRLKPGNTLPTATQDLKRVAAELARRYPSTNQYLTAQAVSVNDALNGQLRQTMAIAMLAAGLVLLIACVNLSGLFWARSIGRLDEFAIRSALGAGRLGLLQSLLCEPAFICLLGASLGGGTAIALATIAETALGLRPVADGNVLNGTLALFVLLITVVSFCAISAAPAWAMLKIWQTPHVNRTTGFRIERMKFRYLFVAIQVTATVVIASCAAQSFLTFRRLTHTDPGMRFEEVKVLRLPIRAERDPSSSAALLTALAARVRELSGVGAAAITGSLPMGGNFGRVQYLTPGQSPIDGHNQIAVYCQITPDFLKTMGIQLVRGRDISATDSNSVLINQSLARQQWAEADPIGQRIILGSSDTAPVMVCGVVADEHHIGIKEAPPPTVYMPFSFAAPWARGNLSLVFSAPGSAQSWQKSIEAIVKELEPNARLGALYSFSSLVDRELEGDRQIAKLFATLSGIAVFLACFGIYGVSTFVVATRNREWAIRLALGASFAHIIGTALRETLWAISAGAVGGIAGAIWISQGLQHSRIIAAGFGLGVYIWPAILVSIVALCAGLRPALRATKVQISPSLRVS